MASIASRSLLFLIAPRLPLLKWAQGWCGQRDARRSVSANLTAWVSTDYAIARGDWLIIERYGLYDQLLWRDGRTTRT